MNQETGPAPAGFSEQQLHTLFELISDGIWDWNANTGYVYRNPGWYAMLGYTSHSMANSVLTWESVIHPEDYPRVMGGIKKNKCKIKKTEKINEGVRNKVQKKRK